MAWGVKGNYMLETVVCNVINMIVCDIIGVPIAGGTDNIEALLPGPNFGGPECPTPDLGIIL